MTNDNRIQTLKDGKVFIPSSLLNGNNDDIEIVIRNPGRPLFSWFGLFALIIAGFWSLVIIAALSLGDGICSSVSVWNRLWEWF